LIVKLLINVLPQLYDAMSMKAHRVYDATPTANTTTLTLQTNPDNKRKKSRPLVLRRVLLLLFLPANNSYRRPFFLLSPSKQRLVDPA
jgi:hypothetical protein